MKEARADDGPTIPVRMNKRTTVTTLRHMNGDHLLGLRDVRRSENGAYVRCHNETAEDIKRMQVNVFYKDQRWQLEKIKRGQRQFYKRLVKVHRDKRKCQREEYKRKQEEIRQDLQNIRLRRLIKRVGDRFRENVKRKKAERTRKRYAIAGGMRSYMGNGANKHGVFGVKSQASATDSVTRMVKLAAKKKTLQREGILPTEVHDLAKVLNTPKAFDKTDVKVVNEDGQNKSTPSHISAKNDSSSSVPIVTVDAKSESTAIKTQNPKAGNVASNTSQKEAAQPPTEAVSISADVHFEGNVIPSVRTADFVLTENRPSVDKSSQNNEGITGDLSENPRGEPTNKRAGGVSPSPRGRSRLTVENLAVHDLSKQDDNRTSDECHKNATNRIPMKTTVIQVTKNDTPKSSVRIAPDSVSNLNLIPEELSLEPNNQTAEQTKAIKSKAVTESNKLGELRVPRRATLKPPPDTFLLKIDAVDAVKEVNKDLEESANSDDHKEPYVPLSRIIRLERKAREAEQLRELNEELIPHYKRNQKGELQVQMVPFIRTSFIPPSNKIRYQQEKMKKEEKLNMARQRVRIRNFVHQCPVAENIPVRIFQDTSPVIADVNTTLNQASLATLMFSVYHKELPPEGVDPNSVEALKKCRYIRTYDIVKTRKLKQDIFRKQLSSWENPSMTEQEKRRQLFLQRQQAFLNR